MKKGACLAMLVLAALWNRPVLASDCFADGNKWEEWNQAPDDLGQVMQVGFVRGFVDTMVLWHRNAGVDPSWVATCVVPMSANEVRDIVDKYVSAHPKNRSTCVADLALAALVEACSGETSP